MNPNNITPTPAPALKGVLFDLDGVITDTEGTYSIFWGGMWDEYGNPNLENAPASSNEFAQIIKGSTLERILNTWFPDKETQRKIVERLNAYEENMQYQLFPGIEHLLTYLNEHNIPAAIVTSSGEKKMSNLFRQHPTLKDHFQAIITDAQVTRSKPDPQGYLLGAEAIGVPASECYVLEDSLSGLKAGRAAGAYVVGVATTLAPDVIAPYSDKVVALAADIINDIEP